MTISRRTAATIGVAVAVVVVAAVIVFTRDSGSSHQTATTTTTTSTSATASESSGATSAPASSGRSPLPGFGETHLTVTTSNGMLAWCLLLAETEAQHNRGLMQVTDPTLGGYDGMLFRFPQDTQVQFYMRNTPMPLSIAFVSSDGKVVSTTDMAPCADRGDCPLYSAKGPYRTAIEVPQGGLTRLGIETGVVVTDDHRTC
jgi:uncharacterized membrane protein (UPF0127 family)